MNDDYGKQISMAMSAIEQLHADCNKLIRDFDKRMPKWKSLFGATVTKDLAYTINSWSNCYMAEGLFRYYIQKGAPNLTRALTTCFRDPKTDEPLLLVGEIKYQDPPNGDPKEVCDAWDLWYLYFGSADAPVCHKLLELSGPGPNASSTYPHPSKVLSARLIAVPLYAIKSIDDVQALMEQVSVGQGNVASAVA